jgi:hypothetical protein
MPNENGRAYGLSTFCPLLRDDEARNEPSHAAVVRDRLRCLAMDEDSPLARVPNLYLCRLFVLDDVFYQGDPAGEDHLKNKYLVFIAELHGSLEPVLESMWHHCHEDLRPIWEHGVGFHGVNSAQDWVRYIKQCQVETTFYFNGSNDEPLAEQLKGLYLKQELGKFAAEHQGRDAASLQRAFKEFVARVEPFNLAGPTFRPGASSLNVSVMNAPTTQSRL